MVKIEKLESGGCPPYSHLDDTGDECEYRENCKRKDGSDFYMNPEGRCIADCGTINYNTDENTKKCVQPDCPAGQIWDDELGCIDECAFDQKYDPEQAKCVARCSESQDYDPATGKCLEKQCVDQPVTALDQDPEEYEISKGEAQHIIGKTAVADYFVSSKGCPIETPIPKIVPEGTGLQVEVNEAGFLVLDTSGYTGGKAEISILATNSGGN